MQYYKIEFNIDGVISFSDVHPPCFDGLLAYAYLKHTQPSLLDCSELSIQDIQNFDNLPICKHEAGYFIASQIQYDKDKCTRNFRNLNTRWDSAHDYLADFGTNKAIISQVRGDFKSGQLQLQTKWLNCVWFYFASADIDFVRTLVDELSSIGKKHNQMGVINSYEIIELDYNPFEAVLLRPIPVNIAIAQKMSGIMKNCTWKPPYHEARFAERCFCPKP